MTTWDDAEAPMARVAADEAGAPVPATAPERAAAVGAYDLVALVLQGGGALGWQQPAGGHDGAGEPVADEHVVAELVPLVDVETSGAALLASKTSAASGRGVARPARMLVSTAVRMACASSGVRFHMSGGIRICARGVASG